ncbi:MAG: UDP-N-acetylmuramoyl-tripeptide--D-alanyl-D-alanine ligase, partial [Patescibacteria group bacterium]|nr:UDP-N-acetylmuramoyl-tripeptide--D-alanyl-D-alanine ligase [Patescibacteria group bacterium]
RLVIKKYKPKIVAVTGSVGKTSTKDAIFEMLKYPVECLDSNPNAVPSIRKSDKSFNSEIGVPLTILGVRNAWKNPFGWYANISAGMELILFKNDYPSILVLEIGADHPGDIERVTKWLKPDIAVLSKVGDMPVHVEFFKSPEEVLKEKLFLPKAVKANGTVILFADDAKTANLTFEGRKIITFGFVESATVRGADYSIVYTEGKPTGISFSILYKEEKVVVKLDGVIGTSHVYPILAAAAVAVANGQNISAVSGIFSKYNPPRGRMNIISGINDSTLIDDTYNSSPVAVSEAIRALALVETAGRKIAVLGDMMELGKYSAEEHRKIGEQVATSAAILITVGQRARRIAESAKSIGMAESNIMSFNDSTEAAEKLQSFIQQNDVVLIKGSQSPRLERVTKALMDEPSRSGELLVRQEKEWLDKK